MFDSQEIKETVEKYLDKQVIPDGHKGALVTVVGKSGVTIVAASKLGKGWQASGQVTYVPHVGGLDYGIGISKTW